MKSDDVTERMGVYKTLDDVPDRYRLESFADAYRGRDVWDEWLTAETETAYTAEKRGRAGRYWREHMEDRGRHHALATPEDCREWARDLLDGRAPKTAQRNYWLPVEQFYDWLMWHTDHPHLINPVHMAHAQFDDEQLDTLWKEKRPSTQNHE